MSLMQKICFKKNKNKILAILSFSFIILFFIDVPCSHAGVVLDGLGTAVATLLSWVAWVFIEVIGLFLTLLLATLVNVAKYNDIISAPIVVRGWVVIRDLCNMSFVVILLVIAFGTILKANSNSFSLKVLPKLLLMAVLINFSRTIFGLIIDFSQVVMMTFVSAFAENGAGNFANMFMTHKILSLWTGETANSWPIVVGIILGVVAFLITCVVVAVILGILIIRIVMLWIYTMLSPLVFLGFAFPPLAKHTQQIWSDFIKQAVTGPVLAFFLWLALTLANDTTSKFMPATSKGGGICAGPSSFFCEGSFQTFILTIGVLMGGLMVAQQAGGAAGKVGAWGANWAKKTPKLMGAGAVGVSSWGARKLGVSTGLELRPSKIITGWKQTLKGKEEDENVLVESKAAARLKEGKIWGALGASRDFSESAARGFMWHKGWYGGDSVMGQVIKKGRAQKDIKKLEEERAKPETTDKRKEAIDIEIKKKQEKLGEYKLPQTFYADQKRNAMINEQKKHFGDNDNADYLHDVMMKAMDEGQESVALAAFLHLPKVGHSNEAMQLTTALEDYKNEKGEVIFTKGDSLTADRDGMACFMDQYLKGKLGLTDHEALSAVMSFSTSAKNAGRGHMNMAEMIGSKGGSLFLRSAIDQESAAANEAKKMDSEKNTREGNRLFEGGEKTFKNELGNTERVMICNTLTEKNFINQMPIFYKETVDTGRINPNKIENFFRNFALQQNEFGQDLLKGTKGSLLDIAQKLDFTFKDHKQETRTPTEVACEMMIKGKSLFDQNLFAEKESKRRSGGLTPAEKAYYNKREALAQEAGRKLIEALEKEQKKTGTFGKKKETKKSKKKSSKEEEENDNGSDDE